jgi:uncharacterized repeat protein (TIGR01451 family)
MAAFYNQAILSYSGGTVNSNITTGELVEVLSVTKTAVVDEYSQGSDITYVINVINSGSVSYSGLTLTDNLGAYSFNTSTLQPLDYVDGSVKYFINGVLQTPPSVTTTEGIIITPISVPANGEATVVYTVTANEFASPVGTGTIENTVTVSGNGIADVSATETVTASSAPSLGISKSISPTTITENDPLTYTFVISNYGNTEATAADNVVITDTFNPAFDAITVTYNGTQWTEPDDYSYDSATGLFTTVAGAITVPPATYSQNPITGEWTVTPGTSTLVVTGNI